MRHELAAVADTENGNAKVKDLLSYSGRTFKINTVGTACEDDTYRIHRFDLFEGSFIGFDFAVHAALTHTSGDKLIVLTAEVENNNHLMGHWQYLISQIIENSYL